MISVRELQQADIPLLLDYWFNAEPSFLEGMGVDLAKMPARAGFEQMLMEQLQTPLEQKKAYCLVWLQNNIPIGHCNTNPTFFGVEAKMHLHLWQPARRMKGLGTELVKLSVRQFFDVLKLQTIWCEPYALNPAPNKTLAKAGFRFVKQYITTPGFINFEQPVNQWQFSSEQLNQFNT